MDDIVERLREDIDARANQAADLIGVTRHSDMRIFVVQAVKVAIDKLVGDFYKLGGQRKLAADEIESLRSRAEKAEAERYQLSLAICGGEDAPGYLDSIPVETIVDVARSNHNSHMNDIDRLMAAEATCEKLSKALEPFAKPAAQYDPEEGDDNLDAWAHSFKIGHLRNARSALSEYRKEASE